MDFKIAATILDSQEVLKQALLGAKLARYVLYVKWGAYCVDLCLFDDEGKPTFSYKDLKDKFPSRTDDLSSWGVELFGPRCISHETTSKDVTILHDKDNVDKTCAKGVNGSGDGIGAVKVHTDHAYHLTQSAHLASSVVSTCRTNPSFLQGFQCFACCHRAVHRPTQVGHPGGPEVSTPTGVVIHVREPSREYLDLAWDERIHHLVGKKGVLEDAMSWLNTLGGGYSALGDYYQHHAKQAAEVSVRQLRVAITMGDPPTVLRCHLYFGLSLMQRGQLRRAKHIIRHQYRLAKKVAAWDTRLQASCQGLWSRLRYLYALRRQPRDVPGLCPSG